MCAEWLGMLSTSRYVKMAKEQNKVRKLARKAARKEASQRVQT
tara:strand:- start:652 stop:780 length:129 start_codon:yes stop_codon:yes gene_type:complete